MMRKGFQKLAAEMLAEIAVQGRAPAIVTVDDGNSEDKFYIPPDRVDATIQAIDAAGDSTQERIRGLDQVSSSVIADISEWLSACFNEPQQLRLAKQIFDEEFLRDPKSCIELFGKYSNLSNPRSGKTYSEEHPLIIKLAQFIPPPPGGRIKESTGPGEFALSYLFGTPPARAAGYDFLIGNIQYTVKHQASAEDLGTFVYKFRSNKKTKLAANYETNIADLTPDLKDVFDKALTELGYTPGDRNTPTKLSKSLVAALILDLKRPSKNSAFKTEDGKDGKTRWALVCSTETAAFRFAAFSISSRLEQLHQEEIASSRGRNVVSTNKIQISPTEIKIKLAESRAKKFKIISELSRRDQQDVESIARRIAQEVLEDELGDDFDKAVRREMLVSLKDKEVESGVADVSRDFMRKFYRSLGTASSSPLDKVKV